MVGLGWLPLAGQTGETGPAVAGAALVPAPPFAFRLSPAQRIDGERLAATLTITVVAEHHLYREQTTVHAQSGHLSLNWPPIRRKMDPFEGKEIAVFDTGTHEIGLVFSGVDRQTEVPLVVGYQGCSSITCFMPEEERLTLRIPGPTPGFGEGLGDSAVMPPAPPSTGAVAATATPDSVPAGETAGAPPPSGSLGPAPGRVEPAGLADSSGATASRSGPPETGRAKGEADGRADGRTHDRANGRADGQANGRADGRAAGPAAPSATEAGGRGEASEAGNGVVRNGVAGDGVAETGMIGQVGTPGGTYDFGRALREKGLLWAILIAFVGGFLVSLTPCVYPMIPITLSIIGGRSENTSFGRGLGLSVTYVAGLSLTYALLGLIVALFGAQVRSVLQGAGFQLVMAGIFVVLALSMFDLFMLQAPEALRQRVVGLTRTGLGGIFGLGMVSGLMASPCVAAPLAGILAFIAASGNVMLGFTMLLAFAWGMGLILVIIGAFAGSLNALPKAGDWMVKVKEFYGFLLLGAAFSFAQPFIGAPWAGLLTAGLLAAFAGFLGVFGPVSAENALSERVARCLGVVALAVACAFAISAAGQWGALCLPTAPAVAGPPAAEARLPLWHDRLEDGLAQAAREHKPVFVDFRADWCTICKELERDVFPHPTVAAVLHKYVLVKIDATTPPPPVKAVLERFGVVGLPTLVILDLGGRERADLRVVGHIGVDDLAHRLRQGLRERS